MRDPTPAAGPPRFLPDLHDPAGCWGHVVAHLVAGATSPGHPFRWPVLCTHPADGRVVVLRRFDAASPLVVFHTDVRSPKVARLRANPRCGFVFHDPAARLQVRLTTAATVRHADTIARVEFDSQPEVIRASYASVGVPGEEEAIDAAFDYPPPPPVDEGAAFGQFAAVACVIETADVLELHASGHRRAVFSWEKGELRMRRVGA